MVKRRILFIQNVGENRETYSNSSSTFTLYYIHTDNIRFSRGQSGGESVQLGSRETEASNLEDKRRPVGDFGMSTPVPDLHTEDQDDMGSGTSKPSDVQADSSNNNGNTTGNQIDSLYEENGDDEMVPLRVDETRASEARSLTPLPIIIQSPSADENKEIETESDVTLPTPRSISHDVSEDGGWGQKNRKEDSQPGTSRSINSRDQKSDKKPRTILQVSARKKKFDKSPQQTPQPYSGSLILQNGRVPAARQQSTLFKDVKLSKMSPKPSDSHYLIKLPSLSSKEIKGSPIPKRQAAVVKPYYTDTMSRRSKALLTKSKLKLSKSEAHYTRLAKMVARVGSDLLRLTFYNYLENQHPPKKLYQFLAANKRRLKSYASTYKLISRRWSVMYPDEDETKAELQKLDSALIFWFLRFICHLKRPNDFIWKRKPASDDVTETGDIARIRDYRNFLINLSSPALYDDEYDRKVEEFKMMAMRLCGEKQGREFVKIIDDMKSGTVRYSEREQYIGILNQWADETGDRQIAPSNYVSENMKDRKEMTRRFLERHRNPQVFVKTKMYQKAQEQLEQHGVVVLKGNTGDGKTTLAIALMVSQFDEDDCMLITSPDQWQFIDPRAVNTILMDDIFGSGSLDERLLNQWETKFDEIYESCQANKDRPSIRVIITIRQHILDQSYFRLAGYKLFQKDIIVDCSSSELFITERKSMLAKHLMADNKTLGKSEIEKSAKSHNSRLGYPQCCAIYVRKEAFLIIGSQFFERPIECLFEQLDRMYDGDKYGYLAMVTMMFQKDGILFGKKLKSLSDDEFKDKFLDLSFLCQVPNSDQIHTFTLNALDNQIGSFVNHYEDRDCYTFSHESVMEAMMASFGERHPQQVLEGCSLPFLMDFVGTHHNFEERGDEIFIMRVKKQNFAVLAKVFVHYILHGEVKRIAQHRAMKDLSFLQFLFQFINLNVNISDILLSEDNNFRESQENKRRIGFLYGAVDQEIPNVELVSALLQTGIHTENQTKERWCELEVESSLCMAVRRGSYDIYKLLIETGIVPPEKLMYEEQFLTSVDIVRDILKRRHWSTEQKDIAVVRAARGLRPESQEIVTLLLQDGAAVNSIRVGTTALCEAVKSGKMKTVLLLLTSGASVNDRDATQQTPLHHACDWNNIEVVKILLKRNADVNARDYLGFSPFLVAVGWGRETILELLMGRKVDCLATDDQLNTVLHICAANGQTKIMQMVMERYKKEMRTILIARNKHGWTPLDFALRCGHLGVTKLLIHAILKMPTPKTQPKTFVHTRFYVVRLEDFDLSEKYQYRFLDENLGRTCFQMPRGHWFIQAGTREEYEEVRQYSIKFESKLRQCLAKS